MIISLNGKYSFAGDIIISSFSTSVADQTPEVKQNISIACESLNGTVLTSRSIFSFNGTVGEGSIKNGYANGLVLYRGEARLEPGGGLCQVSSTLFNAFLLAGMRMVERHRHFQPVTYVPLGLDATIKYGKKDLRVKNPYLQRLVIRATMNDKNLVIIILGEKVLKYRYFITTEEEELSLPLNSENNNIRPGIIVYVYRKKYKNNSFIENFLLYKDFYPPVYIK